MTYDEIWKIAENSGLSYTEKKKKLEGCVRRLVTEILNNAPLRSSQRTDVEYRLIEVLRAVETIASEG